MQRWTPVNKNTKNDASSQQKSPNFNFKKIEFSEISKNSQTPKKTPKMLTKSTSTLPFTENTNNYDQVNQLVSHISQL